MCYKIKTGLGRIRTVLIAVLIATVAFVFTSCGGEGYPEIKIDAVKMANAIINGVEFETNMQQINRDSISAFMDIPEADSAYLFMGAGEKADGFGVFVFDSKDDAQDGEKAVNDYTLWQTTKIGRDINPDRLRNLMYNAGAYSVTVTAPTETFVNDGEVAQFTDVKITYGGLKE
jgi:hypothetical protein